MTDRTDPQFVDVFMKYLPDTEMYLKSKAGKVSQVTFGGK